ncbi:MAG: hypothetical protein ACOC1K_00535 [Nanoarchaeota archaeon]
MKILGSYWFTPMHEKIIGVVKVETKEFKEIKYYIGSALGSDKEADEFYISKYGAKFPKELGDQLI